MRALRRCVRAAGPAALLLWAAAATACAAKAPKPPKDKYAGMTAAQVHAIAQRHLDKKSYARARDTLQKALGRPDINPELTSAIHLGLADAYFFDGGLLNLAEALSRYTNFLTFYPNHEKADYAQYQLGLCYLKQALSPDRDQAQTRKALAELMKVESQYPASRYVAAAGVKAAEARELLAEHEFRIGYFYFKRQAYLGAADRFKEVLERFPGYSRRDRIYLFLGQALIELDRGDEGRLYLEKLRAEFPDSRLSESAR
ncbi:MAG TPA: outer membrane protein assembly factor BamD [Candidatus Polarisedimenticolia bacterium]|nr:outer membrane protein assembly factor BamD [Candidatus Polarisedimenticolia bacterium]